MVRVGSRDNSDLKILRNKGVGTNPPPKGPSPGSPGSRKSQMTIQVSVTETEPFQQILNVIGQIMEDKRIDKGIREEYMDKIMEINYR